ncbi:hypothetical protein LO771_09880 [Streptacidiphilus sp. ASG 303]|uniref:hypothetical protein n=1 Tax=Streptacidiphilus sp. ASG 303 TaxID=2896847 RepID=UPI001E4D3709|nr:hypothetical protein [Streptacidiphilus sp. ASG 303]MCD0482702.1 hypothetical protein [Streptacidiphilus sp. ASG 303]
MTEHADLAGPAHPGGAVRRLLVLPDRDAAEETAAEAVERWPELGEPELVREALAGEDDAEDAQWLVVLEQPGAAWAEARRDDLERLAADHGGWCEDA